MKRKYRKLIIIMILLLIAIAGGSIVWVNSQLKKAHGGYTERVAPQELEYSSTAVIIKNVHILSTDCTEFLPNQNVVLKDGIIRSIHQDTIFSDEYEIIDGTDKYLIPGLVDSHVHLRESKNDLLLYLANGVTYIREMSGNTQHLLWKENIENGELGPHIFVASEKVNSKSGIAAIFETWTRRRINYSTEKEVVGKIRWLSERGFDAVKISTFINADMYKLTVREAKKHDLPVIGHIPLSIGLNNIYHSGQNEIAHVEEITKDLIRKFGRINSSNSSEFLQFLDDESDQIATEIRDNNIAVSSTIWLMESFYHQKFNLDSLITEVELEYANPGLIEGTMLGRGWLPGNNSYGEPPEVMNNTERKETAEIFWKTYADAIHIVTEALAENNVFIMAGTDANVPVAIPGFSLHDELESMSKSGMTNAQVLYAATVAPGIWMKSNTGMIKEGYKSDLVLLSNNPLENIKNTTSIEAVFCGAHRLTTHHIDDILQEVILKNDMSRSINIQEFIN